MAFAFWFWHFHTWFCCFSYWFMSACIIWVWLRWIYALMSLRWWLCESRLLRLAQGKEGCGDLLSCIVSWWIADWNRAALHAFNLSSCLNLSWELDHQPFTFRVRATRDRIQRWNKVTYLIRRYYSDPFIKPGSQTSTPVESRMRLASVVLNIGGWCLNVSEEPRHADHADG